MRVVLLGATKGMGRALARRMAARGDDLFLLGRNLDDLQRSAADLEARRVNSAPVATAMCDLERPETFASALDAAETHMGKIDTIVVTAALFATQGQLEANPNLAAQLLSVNFTNTVVFCEHARKRLLATGGGTLCVFSSVAGERGRSPVVIYGAAKAGLTRYLEGLDHRFRRQGLVTVSVKPGFVATSMTASLPRPRFAGRADDVARRVLEAIDQRRPVVYVPPIWRLIMCVVRVLPRFVMRRTGF